MLSLSACSNEELQAIIISASGELTRRAQTMGSLPMSLPAPMGWPQPPSGPGWPQPPTQGWPPTPPGWPQQPYGIHTPAQPAMPSQPQAWPMTPSSNGVSKGNGASVPAAPPQPTVATSPPSLVPATNAKPTSEQATLPEPAPSATSSPQTGTNSITPLPRHEETTRAKTFSVNGHLANQSTVVDYGDPLINHLVLIYQEATEYPVELLDPQVDLEADLGIDSVKQMQVLGMIKERHGFNLPEGMDMKVMRTIKDVAESLRNLIQIS